MIMLPIKEAATPVNARRSTFGLMSPGLAKICSIHLEVVQIKWLFPVPPFPIRTKG